MITAKVVNPFKEVEHNDHVYQAGDSYPAKGHEATKKRVDFLSKVHPKYKKIYLADIEETQNTENEISEFPKHTGGGWYELSNGEKVQGKDEAFEEEAKLQSGE